MTGDVAVELPMLGTQERFAAPPTVGWLVCPALYRLHLRKRCAYRHHRLNNPQRCPKGEPEVKLAVRVVARPAYVA